MPSTQRIATEPIAPAPGNERNDAPAGARRRPTSGRSAESSHRSRRCVDRGL